jgi:hypothetical protein
MATAPQPPVELYDEALHELLKYLGQLRFIRGKGDNFPHVIISININIR